MRIISGYLSGRNFDAPKGRRTHPMSDKIRGALFGMLGDISGLSILDAFAGSGAVGFEAVSRGAKHVLAVEVDNTAHKVIETNAQALGLTDKLKAVRASVTGWAKHNTGKQFDIVLADPPYDDLHVPSLEKLTQHVQTGGLLVLSWPGHKQPLDFEHFDRLIERNYGDSQLVFYRKTS